MHLAVAQKQVPHNLQVTLDSHSLQRHDFLSFVRFLCEELLCGLLCCFDLSGLEKSCVVTCISSREMSTSSILHLRMIQKNVVLVASINECEMIVYGTVLTSVMHARTETLHTH